MKILLISKKASIINIKQIHSEFTFNMAWLGEERSKFYFAPQTFRGTSFDSKLIICIIRGNNNVGERECKTFHTNKIKNSSVFITIRFSNELHLLHVEYNHRVIVQQYSILKYEHSLKVDRKGSIINVI